VRQGRDLIESSRAFAPESAGRSWWAVLSTTGLMVASGVVLWQPLYWPLRLMLSVLAGFLVVRQFVLFHDFTHGALLRGSKVARCILYPFAIHSLTPPRVWRETHNYHHAHTAQLVGSSIGSFATMTTQQWQEATPAERARYKAIRHPLTVLFAYFTIFMFGMCVMSFARSPKKRWDSALALALNWGMSAFLIWKVSFATFFFFWFFPLFTAHAIGAYLFYAQHNFEGLVIQKREAWCYDRAALHSSSYMEMGPVLSYLTANIGYHHVHHLNPTIPYYRLPEAMKSMPELQNPMRVRLTPAVIAATFELKLWDPQLGRMVGYPEEMASGVRYPVSGARTLETTK
jgi:omega-6 fatty acid desaturase (delta-12 desaturase)